MLDYTCKCDQLGFHPGMSYEDLTSLIREQGTCTDPYFVCSVVCGYLRTANQERDRRKYYTKKLKRSGYTEEQIKEKAYSPKRSRHKGPVRYQEVDLNGIM